MAVLDFRMADDVGQCVTMTWLSHVHTCEQLSPSMFDVCTPEVDARSHGRLEMNVAMLLRDPVQETTELTGRLVPREEESILASAIGERIRSMPTNRDTHRPNSSS